MDVVGGFHLVDGTELKAVSGIDDNSRFVVSALLVARATARPVCEALLAALGGQGVPGADPDRQRQGVHRPVRAGRVGREVMFDRICAENGIRHLLTAPRSPTTTGKVERLHKTMRAEFFGDHRRQSTMAELQAALDGWVAQYNTERPHQSLGMRPPVDRFQLAGPAPPRVTWPWSTRCRCRPRPRLVLPARGSAAARGAAVGRPARPDLGWPGSDIGCRSCWPGNRSRPWSRSIWSGSSTAMCWSPNMSSAANPTRTPRLGRGKAPDRPDGDQRADGDPDRRQQREGVVRRHHVSGRERLAGPQSAGLDRGRFGPAGLRREIVRVHPIRHDRAKEHGAFATPNGRPRKPRKDPTAAASQASLTG